MPHYRQAPTYEQAISAGTNTTTPWYRWFQDIDNGTPPTSESSVPVTASPMVFVAPAKGFLIVTGGAVQGINFQRSAAVYGTGQTQGSFPVSLNDKLLITYTVAPTLTFVPQ